MPVATPAATGLRKSHSQIGLKVDYNQSTDPVPNLPLLRKVLEHIDAHPEEWRQDSWATRTSASACGTAFCFAGHAVVLAGGELLWDKETGVAFEVTMPDGSTSRIAAAAREALGLTCVEASDLFYAVNARQTVQFLAEAIADRAGEWL